MQTSNDYSGRTVDISIENGQDPTGGTRTLASLTFDGTAVTGIQKAIQKFTMILLTERGTVPSDSTYGTYFLPNFRTRTAANQEGIKGIFQDSAADALAWLKRNDTSALADEVIISVDLLSVEFGVDSVKISAKLNTALGSDLVYINPKLYT